MSRPKIGKKPKTRKDYNYDFPEQRELAEGLEYGDASRIARAVDSDPKYVSAMFLGTSKITPKVKAMAIKFIQVNKLKVA